MARGNHRFFQFGPHCRKRYRRLGALRPPIHREHPVAVAVPVTTDMDAVMATGKAVVAAGAIGLKLEDARGKGGATLAGLVVQCARPRESWLTGPAVGVRE